MVVFFGAILLIVFLYILIKNLLNYKFLIKKFDKFNIITFGKKGSGKDLLTQAIIWKRKK